MTWEGWAHAVHLLGAMFWAGGMFFLVLVLMPIGRKVLPPKEYLALVHVVGRRFRNISWIVLPVVVATGVIKAARAVGSWEALGTTPYGRTLMWKMAAVTIALIIATAHDFWIGPRMTNSVREGASAATTVWRRWSRLSGLALLVLVLAILGLAVKLRMSYFE